MNIAISGSTGFIGKALSANLASDGHQVTQLRRAASSDGLPAWEAGSVEALAKSLAGCDAVIHLAGAGIADRRWSSAYKRQIMESRSELTRQLSEALALMPAKPKVFISASAVGYYGPRGPEALDEQAAPGDDFIAKVCRNWEAAAEPARKAGIRVVHLRIAMVLDANGGALKKMLLPFKLGLGGNVGGGRQFYSWITLKDLISAFKFLLQSQSAQGAYNLSAPGACSNADFSAALGRALRRPAKLPMPAFAARLAFGEMADALLLGGQNVKPSRLLAEGFRFESNSIDAGLASALRKP